MPAAAGPEPLLRPRLRRTVELFAASDGDVYLLAEDDRHLRVRRPGPAQRAALQTLAADEPGAADDTLIAQLGALRLLEDAGADERLLAPELVRRFERQLRYFGDLRPDVARGVGQRRLAGAHVVILGLGGLGSWALQALACTGVGRITAADCDVIELSNLNRQALYAPDRVGWRKTQAAAEWMARFAPSTRFHALQQRLRGAHDVGALARGADLVLGLVDTPVGLVDGWIDEACHASGVPWLSAGQFPPTVRVGPLYVPGRTPCQRCRLTAVRRAFPLYDELCASRRRSAPSAATFGPASGIIGCLLASEAVNLLTGLVEPSTAGRYVTFDLRSLEMTSHPVARDPSCARCRAK